MTTVRTVAVDDPGDLLSRLPSDGPLAWIRQGEGLIGWGRAHSIAIGLGSDRFATATAQLADWFDTLEVTNEVGGPGTGPVAFGSFTFDWDTPGSRLVVPRFVLGRRNGTAWLTAIGEEPPAVPSELQLTDPVRVRYAGASVSEMAWLEAVAAGAAAVRGPEDLTKVVLARDLRVWAGQDLDVRILARRLAERFDGCWTFVHDGLVGATPELLVRRTDGHVESIVLAGSAARGREIDEDKRLGEELLTSSKDRTEHDIAVASVLERLTPVAAGVSADPQPWLLQLANVQHLATRISARIDRPLSALRLAGLLHPTAAVCGTPRGSAMERIRATEGMDRGRYAGPVGWVDAQGNGEFGIALRCAEVTGRTARLFSGAGIVGESLPELELEETRLKLRAMQSALEGTAP